MRARVAGRRRVAGLFAPAINHVTGPGPADVAVGDLAGDGNDSLAVANTGNGTVSVLLGDGGGTARETGPAPAAGAATAGSQGASTCA
ncbi:hypothetical protein [Parafrankia discariae]|uniref:hypothetical protein n=1 Tax=Parafrankia discariae TaxID=365528 RepID=UPI0012B6963C|nr:hypothetical protein [Parafrankia discariae]